MSEQNRELLERAARAYWSDELEDMAFWFDDAEGGIVYVHADNQDHEGLDREFLWNPLENTEDAVRLAIKLRINIVNYFSNIAAVEMHAVPTLGVRNVWPCGQHLEDRLDAMRIAVTLTAAKLSDGLAADDAAPASRVRARIERGEA